MKTVRAPAKIFEELHSLLGPMLWALSIQYFVAQFIVALGWAKPYSVLHNTISDLGNTACGPYRGSVICSPTHGWMNVSFVTLGLSMSLGSLLIYRYYAKTPARTIGFGSICLAGVGTALVGIFPENTISVLHVIGAALPFAIGNVALVILGRTLPMPRALRYYTIMSGCVALIALLLFLTHTYVWLEIGGMERITAYPLTIWLMVFGTYCLYHVAAVRGNTHTAT